MSVPRRFDGWWVALRSAAVGAAATFVDLAVLATLVHALDVGARLASPFALLSGVIVQFVGNKLFAFGDASARWGAQAVAFFAVEAGAFTLNAIGFDLLVTRTPLPAIAARIVVSSSVYFLFCLPLWSRVFARPVAVQAQVG